MKTEPEQTREATPMRMRIYQLLPRLFGNVNERRKENGTIEENGVGKFGDINEAALESLKGMGFTHLWVTGVLRQATGTDYSGVGLPADDADLLKGLAGSPYAIKDYYDVCPDYAEKPEERLEEFRGLLGRAKAAGLGVVIDVVANHVARSYRSVVRPEASFGVGDDREKFFGVENNFFYLKEGMEGGGPPLRLPTVVDGVVRSPTCEVLGGCDGRYEGELDHGKVTGNNRVTWAPGLGDWYETIKLNYGYDFTTGAREYPVEGEEGGKGIPETWKKMDGVLAYWQEMGVEGFRCDMAHMVPAEFWGWAIGRAKERDAGVIFFGEAYENDPMKVGEGNVLGALIGAGFAGVYDDPSYKVLKGIYDGGNWANDLDGVVREDAIFHGGLRYVENHDEVRLAGQGEWGGVGMEVGRGVSGLLYGLGRGPVLVYHGQEVGERGAGAEGFSRAEGRTTIFDYWSMPELVKWVNGHRYDGGGLSVEQVELREFYGRLLRLVGRPAFAVGECFRLNYANGGNERYGRVNGEGASGHWVYGYLRYDAGSGERFLVVVNLHPREWMRGVEVRLPREAVEFLGWGGGVKGVRGEERLDGGVSGVEVGGGEDGGMVVKLGEMKALGVGYIELEWVEG